jgi:hypothetical protein
MFLYVEPFLRNVIKCDLSTDNAYAFKLAHFYPCLNDHIYKTVL